jgi:hypothetical protein
MMAARGAVAMTVLAAATALVAGTAVALLGFVFPGIGSESPEPVSEPCADPPCPPESLPSGVELVASLPVVAPVLLVGAGLLLAVVAAGTLLTEDRARGTVARCALLVAGPLLVLVGAEVLPHVATPCWAGEVPGVCEATAEHGIDYADSVHPFGHALLGWVPLTILHVWSLRRWWPQVVPQWVPGGDRKADARVER